MNLIAHYYVARTRQHWNRHDTRIHGRFLKHTRPVRPTCVLDIFRTWYDSIIGASVLHRHIISLLITPLVKYTTDLRLVPSSWTHGINFLSWLLLDRYSYPSIDLSCFDWPGFLDLVFSGSYPHLSLWVVLHC